jgi:small GTP-binding protein
MLKVLLAGDGGVGKSSIVQRFIKKKFVVDYKFTVGVDTYSKDMPIKDGVATLSIWDMAGQEHYNFMRGGFYHGTDGVLLVFDLTRPPTFENCKKWIEELQKALGENIPFILIGNKADLLEDTGEVIKSDKPREFAEQEKGSYEITSAKTGLNIEKVFTKLTQEIIESQTYSVEMFSKLWEKNKIKKKM